MTRSDILLDTKDVLKEMDETKLSTNHVEEMADILDDFWLLMLKLEENDNFEPLGQIMRKIFYRENK